MMNQDQHLQSLLEIRSLMERSVRFISLSGLSGVVAGTIALIGAGFMYAYLQAWGVSGIQLEYQYRAILSNEHPWGISLSRFILLDFASVLIFAILFGYYFTQRKAKRMGQKVWNSASLKLLGNLSIPLVAGGLFCLSLIYHGLIGLVAPATLIFYGLALVNGSKYTLEDIRYLGFCEIILGLAGMVYIGLGLVLWAFGFGVLHIVYGAVMYKKYETN